MDIQEKVQKFIIAKSEQFSLEEIKETLFENKNSSRLLEDYLEESPFLFPISKKDKYYTPRSIFFNSAKFIITPSKSEVKNNILIPGHRFIPFYPEELFPTESFKIKAPSGKTLKTRTMQIKLEDIYPYYSLLGAENIIDHLIADDHKNQQVIGNPTQKVNISVFDFSDVYANETFAKSNSLLFTVKDWNRGIFTVSPIRTACSKKCKEKWLETMEKSLCKVFEEKGPQMELPEQLALAYYYSGQSILQNPPCSIDEFIRQSDKIQILFYENNTILWYADNKESTSCGTPNNQVSISLGSIESLDAILEELGIKFSSRDIKKLMEESLKSSDNSIFPVIKKIFPKSGITFKDKAQEAAFYNHLEELWEETAASSKQAEH